MSYRVATCISTGKLISYQAGGGSDYAQVLAQAYALEYDPSDVAASTLSDGDFCTLLAASLPADAYAALIAQLFPIQIYATMDSPTFTNIITAQMPEGARALSIFNTGGDELITNTVDRDFSGAGHWTGTNWAITSAALKHTAGSTTSATLGYANIGGIYANRPHLVTFTVSSCTAGTITPKLGAVSGPAVSANGTYRFTITPTTAAADLIFTPTTDFDGAIDNVSLLRLADYYHIEDSTKLGIWKAATLPGSWKPTGDVHLVTDSGVSGSGAIWLEMYSENAVTSMPALVSMRGRGTVGSKAAVLSGDGLGWISFQGCDGTNMKEAASVKAAIGTGTISATSMPGVLIFLTTPDGSVTPTERMRIDAAGNVGIGTTAPDANLTILNSTNDSVSTIHTTKDSAINYNTLEAYRSSGGTLNTITFKGARGSKTSPAKVQSGDVFGSLTVLGYYDNGSGTVGFDATARSYLTAIASEDWTVQNQGAFEVRIRTRPTGTSAPSDRLTIDKDGNVIIAGDTLRILTTKTPASAGAAGVAGTICWDANYVYVCTATNTWKRAALSTW